MLEPRVVRPGAASLVLLAEHAAWLDDERALLVADVHLGKAESYRRLGMPVPAGVTAGTLARLGALLSARRPRLLVVLGDLLHGPQARQPESMGRLAAWRAEHSGVAMTLVRGNHDDRAGDLPARVGITVVAGSCRLAGWRLDHAPPHGFDLAGAAAPYVCGHLHPAVRFGDRITALRRPCFWARADGVVLPAFGEFTGGWTVQPAPGDRVYVSDGTRVVEVPPAGLARRSRQRR